MSVLALDIGGTKYTLAVFEEHGMAARVSRSTDAEGGREWMLAQLETQIAEWRKSYRFERCGIGFGGPVNFEEQCVALSTHVGGWQDFRFADWVSERADAPALIDNDANVGALGEALYGAGRGCSPLFYMTLSTGIGGGIYWNGQILRGPDSYGGEIGHIEIEPGGPECLCGWHGCFERMCCGLWLQRDYGRAAKELMEDAEFVRRYVVYLARGLKAAVMLLNPERIVIGGGISKAGPKLFEPLRAELRRQVTGWSRARLDVQPAGLGDDSVLWGALALNR